METITTHELRTIEEQLKKQKELLEIKKQRNLKIIEQAILMYLNTKIRDHQKH